jgi:hypothetical protein
MEKQSIIKFKVENQNNVVITEFNFNYSDATLKITGLKKNICKAITHLDKLFEVVFVIYFGRKLLRN